jgi:hypothetical protein
MLSGIRPLLLWCKAEYGIIEIMQEIRRNSRFFCIQVLAHSSLLWK